MCLPDRTAAAAAVILLVSKNFKGEGKEKCICVFAFSPIFFQQKTEFRGISLIGMGRIIRIVRYSRIFEWSSIREVIV